MSTMKTKKTFGLVFAALLVISLYFSCEVGLGSAVDIQAPEITIEKPEVDMVIRQKFIISGTWSDDGIIDNVYIKLKRTDGRAVDGKSKKELDIPGSFEVSPVDKELGTWKAEIDPLDDATPIVDGTYQATVVIKDKGKHTTTQSTTFTIDNTAPVLILTKPNSTPGDKTVSAYGQRLFLEGSIADSTKDTWVEINFYSDEECTPETLLTTLETGLIAPTDVNSNNAKLAVFNADLTKELAEEYKAIYGQTTKNGPRTIYSKITVYDTAETCTETDQDQPTGKNGKIKGNASQSFYFSKLLAESITKSQDANGYGLAPIDIYNVLNGTYSLKNEARSGIVSSVKDKLENSNLKKDKTVFTINPENSPYFTVSGLKTLNLDGKDFEEGNTIVNGTQTLEISVFMGSDSIALKDDENFYVYLLECDNYGVPLDQEDNESSRIKLYSKYDETGSGANKKIYYEIGGKTDHKTTSGAYVFSVPMSKSIKANPDLGEQGFAEIPLEFGHNYIIRVSGTDTEDNQIETTDTGYGFRFTAGGVAPSATIEEPKAGTIWVKKGEGVHVKGTVKSEEGEPRFMVMNGNDKVMEITLTQTAENGVYAFEDDIPSDAFDQTESLVYSLEFLATRDETKSTYPKSIWYDVDGPEITMGDPTPIVKAGSRDGVTKDSVNGKIQFSGSIIDSFDQFKSATYSVEQDGAVVTADGLSGNLTSNFNFEIDTTKLADKKDTVIVITAYDRAGNETVAKYTYYIDQQTDKPVLSSTSAEIDGGLSETVIEQDRNLFIRGGTLVLSVTDDDFVNEAEVSLQRKKDDGSFEEIDYEDGSATGTRTFYNKYEVPSVISHTLPNTVGIYKVTVTVYDNNYVSATATPNNLSEKIFMLRITGTGPDVTVEYEKEYISTRDAAGTNKVTFKVTGTPTDRYKLYVNNELKGSDLSSPFEHTLSFTKGTTSVDEITFKITNNQGYTEKFYTPTFDNDKPSITFNSAPTQDGQTEDATFLFKGGMGDETSRVEKVYIKFINGNSVSDIDAAKEDTTGWTECVCGSATWNCEVVWADNSIFTQEGQKTAIAKAVDLAGNEEFTSIPFKYDTIKPSVTAITGNTTTKGENVVLTISIKDTNPVAPLVEVTGYNGTITATTPTGSGNAWTSTVTIPFASTLTTDKEYEIQVTAKDANGRTAANPQKVTIIRDSVAPVITYTSPASASATFIRKNSYKFEGNVADTNEITKAEITLYKKASGSNPDEKIGDTETISLNSDGTWAWQFYELDPGTYYVKVYAKDIAGNETTTNSISVNVDNTPPIVTLSHTGLKDASGNAIPDNIPLSSGTTYYANGNYTIYGVVSDLNFEYSTELVEITSPPTQTITVTPSSTNIFAFKPETYTDGNFTYTIKVKDKAGNNADEITIRVWLDKTGPTVTIKNPKNDITDSTQALDDDTYTFRINAVDGNGVGVAKLYYAFSQNASAPAAGEWKQETFTDGDKNIDMNFVTGTTTGTAPYTQLCEGTWYLYAKAIDKSGNETTSTAKRIFPIDKAKPTLTVTGLSESDVNPLYAEISNGGYTISGTVSDTNGLAASNAVVVSVDNQTPQAATVTGSSWSYKIQTGDTAGKLQSNEPVVVKVTATDKAGKTTSKSYTLYYDTKDPELEVTAPVSGEAVASASKEIKGTVSDGGYGIKKLEYKLYKGTTSTVIDSGSTEGSTPNVIIKGEQWYISGEGKISLGDDQGALRLVVTATENDNGKTGSEKSGGRVKEEEISFYYDEAAPSLTETGIGTTGKTTNTSFTLSGNTADTNTLASITINWGTNNSITLTPGQEQLKTWNWSQEFVVGSAASGTNKVADGTNEFTIIAKDIAGKEKTLSRTVVVDTTKPTVRTITVDTTGGTTIGEGNDKEIWYKTTSVPVTVAVSDSGTGSAFSAGISKVEYQAGSGSYAPLSMVGNNFSGTVNFSGNGTQTLKIKATDVAGNESTVKNIDVHIDTTAPELSALYYKKGTDSAVAVDGAIYVKSNTQLTVYGNYTDAESGINALSFAYGNPTVTYSETEIGNSAPADGNYTIEANSISGKETSIKSWKAVFTPTDSGAFTVSGSNRTTNPTATLKVFDVTVDGDKPVVDNVKLIEVKAGAENLAYSDGSKYFVNNTAEGKTFKISGVATDLVGVDSVKLLITKNGTTTTKTATRKGTLGQWYFDEIDLSDWSGTGAKVNITVKDKAGNVADENVEFNIAFDVTAPATEHKIDDSQKNLEFRIGDYENDAHEEDVGGKYSNGTYGSALTMLIRGNFPDEDGGSGINKFYYKTFNSLEVKINSDIATGTTPVIGTGENEGKIFFKNDAALINYVVANKTDIFSPIAVETRNVEYNMTPADPVTNTTGRYGGQALNNYAVTSKGYVQFRTSVDTNFKTTMKGFNEGKNYLVIVAEDNAGNLGLDTATVGNVEYPCYSLNVDITAPTIPQKHEDPVFTNVVKKLEANEPNPNVKVEISGTVSDAPNKDAEGHYITYGSSGIKEIVFTSDQNSETVKLTEDDLGLTSDAIATDPSPKPWTVDVRPLLSDDGTAIISAKVTDNAGFSTSVPVANITVDRKRPVVTINSPSANSVKGKKLSISGIANDGNGAGLSTKAADKIILYATTKSSTDGIVTSVTQNGKTTITGIIIGSAASEATTKWVKLAEVATTDEWEFANVDVSSIAADDANTPVYFTVAVKDASGTGNTGYATPHRIVIDRKVPNFVSGTVGGKTDTNAWFNSRTINISGSFTDPATNTVAGSGVNYIYYSIDDVEAPALPTTNDTYNTNITIPGTSSSATLKIWATDAAGNTSSKKQYSLSLDGDAPDVVEYVTAQQPAGYFNNSTLTDGQSAKTFTFLVQDKAGGSTVKTSDTSALEVKVGRYALTTTGTDASSLSISQQANADGKENYLVTLVIGKTDLGKLSGNTSVLVTVTDVAGNKSPATSIGSLNVDKTPPTVTIKDPEDKSTATGIQINGTFTLEGTARDNNALLTDTGTNKSLKLYYTTKTQTTGITTYANSSTVPTSITTGTNTATAWKALDSAVNGADWSFSVNTKSISAGKQTVHFLVETKDEAGNTGYSNPKTLEIDQDTDRPVINFSNIELGTSMSSSTDNNHEGFVWLKNTTKVIGTVSDDDGVQSMQISLDGSDWKSVTLTGSAFSYDLKNFYSASLTEVEKEAMANGPKTIYFKVTDKASAPDTREFTSAAASSISAVKISDGTNEYGNSTKPDSHLYIKVDTLYPQVILKGAKLASEENYTNAYNTIRLGGDKKSFVVKFAASDASGIQEVSGTADFVYTTKSGNQENQNTLSKTGSDLTTATEDGETVYILTFALADADVTTLTGNSGAVNVRVVATDNAGNETPQTASVAYDFAPSTVTSWNPNSETTLSGSVTAYGMLTENAKVWYAISPSATVGPNDAVGHWTDGDGNTNDFASAKTVQDWQELPGNSNTWTVNFDNGSSDASHEKSLNMYLIDYGIANRKTGALATSDDIESSFNKFVKLYLWIKTEDDAGNIKADSVHELLVDPQGDKPSIAFSYPSENSKTLGNEVSIYGTAQDLKGTNIGVDSVWVQIKSTTHIAGTTGNFGTAPSYDEATGLLTMTLTTADLDYMTNNGYNVYKMSDYVVGGQSNTKWTAGGTTTKPEEWAALASSSGASWNISINKDAHKELNPPEGTNSNAVGIRVFARDGDGKLSLKADRYVIFDADNPIIKDLYLVQSTDGKLSTASTASRQYTPDMFVKGKWYLTGTVTDNMGISELSINGETLILTQEGTTHVADRDTYKGTETDPQDWTDCVTIAASGDGEIVTFKYPLNTDVADSFDKLSFRIVAKDKVSSGYPHEKEEPISINYDNKAPEIATTEEAGKSISADVQQRNSWYTFSSKVTEASADNKTQSGFAYTAFYFTRNDTVNSKNYLYDVLKARDVAAVDLTGKTIATAFGSEAATENTIVRANDIYWYRKNITRQASLNTFTVSNTTGIRKNALVNIDGAMYLITGVNGTSVTIDGYPKQSATVAYVAIAGIVDNTIPEGEGETIQSDGYYNPPSRDDGDRMIESVDKSGTTWTWQAQICSRNISDGPITLHYVVFDNAGNKTYDSVAGTVSNNRPRIAGALFATDYNGDGDTEDEGETFTNYSIARSYTDYWTGGTEAAPVFDPDKNVKNSNAKNPVPTTQVFGAADDPMAVLRGKTVITPEIVGGNGKIYYSYKINDDTTKADQNNKQIIDNGSLDYTAKTGDITIQLGDLLSWNDTANSSTAWPFEFTFWDSTEGTTKFVNSQSATLTMYFAIQAKTVGTPRVTIDPFYWNGLKDNSIEDSNTASSVADLKGHIELEDDWKNTTVYDEDAEDGLYDGDPKVSGKIVIKGTAHDNSRINNLKATIFGSEKTVATFTANNKLESSFAKTAFDTNHLWFNITNQTIDKTGHTVEWELHIDTATMLSDVAGTDKSVTVTATNFGVPTVATSNAADALVGVNGSTKWAKTPSYTGAKTNTPGTDQTTSAAKKAYYRMDVVPYITKISTAVRTASGLKDNNIRSASGKYSILANNASNTITVNGFNLSTTALVAKIANTATSAGTGITSTAGGGTVVTIAATNTSTATITNSGISKSGYLELFSNTVRALNNINGNNSYGTAKNSGGVQLTASNATVSDYANAYNREPDYYTTKNVQLTDDRYLRFFDMKNTGVKNGYYPVMIMNGNNPVFGYVDSSGGKNSAAGTAAGTGAGTYRYTNAQAQRAEFNGTTGAEVYTEYLVKQLNTNQMGMAMDEGGRFLQATVYDYESAGFALYYDRYNEIHTPASGYGWGPGTGYNGYTGDFAQNLTNNAIVLETCSYPDSTYTAGRYQSPKLIMNGNSKTGNAIVYMSYYDAATGEILFRNFIIGKSLTNTTNSSTNFQKFDYVGSSGGNYYFSCNDNTLNGKYVKIGDNYRQLTYSTNVGGYYRIANNPISSDFSSIIYSDNSGTAMTTEKSSAMNSSGKDNSNDTYEDKINFLENFSVSDQYNTGRLSFVTTGSQYFDMGITSDNHVVIVYLDSSTNELVLKYSTNAIDGSAPTTAVAWTTSTVDFPENIGSYVSLAIDGSSVHIAAFDSFDSNLVYMYLPNYNSATGYKEITVDQASAVGNWTKIKVKDSIPYIAYYNATETGGRDCIKLAYPVAANGKTAAQNKNEPGVDVKPGSAFAANGTGAATGYATGAWEYMTVPAITPPQGGDPKFQQVCLDFDSNGLPVVGYLATNLEFGKWLTE